MEELVWKDFGCAQVRASSAGVSRGRPGSSRIGYMGRFHEDAALIIGSQDDDEASRVLLLSASL